MVMTEIFPEGSDIGKQKRVKFGIDPTSNRLHLGHLVPLRIVKQFIKEGKDVTIVLGTFTAQMGDPSGKDKTRPILSREEVENNAKEILEQVTKILGKGKFRVFKNGDEFNRMTVPRLMSIVSDFTVQQMVRRDAFSKRMASDTPIGVHELIVPILQGTDSVILDADIEVGGTDQLFNFKIARRLQEINGQEPEICVMTPIIHGTDGRKMSKSLENCVFLDDRPENIFGKCMSVSDFVMDEWIPLLTDRNSEKNPMERKKKMAFDIVKQVCGIEMAKWAQEHFESTIQGGKIPDDIKEISENTLIEAVVAIRSCSKSQARRLLNDGAVKVNGVKTQFDCTLQSGQIIKIGKRSFGRIN
jgi:tyrosyl-tRNA synthetase